MPPKPRVLLLGTIDHPPAQAAYNSLSTLATLTTTSATTPSAFLTACQNGSLPPITIIYRTFDSVSLTGPIRGAIVKTLANLGVKAICHNGAGYDQIAVAECTEAGIQVSHVPTAVDASTADTALYLLLGALRGFNAPAMALRKGEWRGRPAPGLGHDPEGKVLGILGMGGIGGALRERVERLGMRVVYYNRRRLKEEQEAGAEYVGFEELLGMSDVISVHLPLNVFIFPPLPFFLPLLEYFSCFPCVGAEMLIYARILPATSSPPLSSR